jgi:hypothetical protein
MYNKSKLMTHLYKASSHLPQVLDALNTLQPHLPATLFRQICRHIDLEVSKTHCGLRIDKRFRVWLNNAEPIELKLYPLNKAVYFLFLRHPEGIRFKCLPDYTAELTELYRMLNKNIPHASAFSAASAITDCSQQHIYQQVSKIKASVRKILPEPIASTYYISGSNGSPKRIPIKNDYLIDEVGVLTTANSN